ncbi:MAG: DUF1592 domain-containing protein [Verrucomicrobiales bacterium]|nr:DUF1592 domain-containing protein [Verrucomicrobiales bacterium]
MTKSLAFTLWLFPLVASSFQSVNGGTERQNRPKSSGLLAVNYSHAIAPLLQQYCYDCHGDGRKKGDIALDVHRDEAQVMADQKLWGRVLKMVQDREMPPENKPQPTEQERELIARWIEQKVFGCDCEHPDPGRVTIRRLNRAEYNNTVRDLLGVNFQPADDFPADDSGYGFDNIGDVLSMPPILIEKYLAAAEHILDSALVLHPPPKPHLAHFPVNALEIGYNVKQRGDGWAALNSVEEDDVAATYSVPSEGEYALRVRAYARQDGPAPIQLTFMLDQQVIKTAAIDTNASAPQIYEARVRTIPGLNRFRAVVRRSKDGLSEIEGAKWKSGTQQKGTVFVEYLDVEGPFNRPQRVVPEMHRRMFGQPVTEAPRRETATAREIISSFARRAYRRPIRPEEVDRLVALALAARREGRSFEQSVAFALQAILVSPHFLFRGELQPEPDNRNAVYPVNEHALACRLSYFLWNSMPDDELFREAERGKLRKNLEQQVRRMLRDGKSRAFVENFAGQWLQLRNLEMVMPDRKTFRDFDESLRAAMRTETELLFETIMAEDRSVLEFLSADYTFANARLAGHYGLTNTTGDAFQRVSLAGTPRRGLLTQASILTITANPTRTSPVKRGKWVLDNLLNAPPPPPPLDVPELPSEKELKGTLRQRMEQHRENVACASCHARMDPIGFGLENFNGIGAWRDRDSDRPIDAGGKLITGESFTGPAELTALLLSEKKDQFIRCLATKMLTYALGRGLEFYDKCALDEIVQKVARHENRFSALVLGIVKSTPFQMRRGDAARETDSK